MGISSKVPMRYVFAALASMGMAIIYGLKANLSVAVVAMINHTAKAQAEGGKPQQRSYCPPVGGGDESAAESFPDGPFNWDANTYAMVMGSYFWGYMVTQFPGGRLSEMFSGKHVFGTGVLMNAIGTVLTPPAAYLHVGLLIAMRVLEGLGGGVSFPGMHVLMSNWVPPAERSRISSIVYAGTALGTVISLPMTGLTIASLGWEWVFYIQGGLTFIWYVAWFFLVYDNPVIHPLIGEEERAYIMGSLSDKNTGTKKPSVPWKAIFTSVPFWAIQIAHICSNTGLYLLLIEMPRYMQSILGFKITQNAVLSALPYLCMWLTGLVLGFIGTYLRQRNMMSVTVFRKVATGVASLIPGGSLIAVSFAGCNRPLAVFFLTTAVAGIAGMYSGFLTNHIDIAPNFAGTLMGITNTAATIPGFVVPMVVNRLTKGNETLAVWRMIFFATAGIYAVEFVVFTLFGTGVEQPWNKGADPGEGDDDQQLSALAEERASRAPSEIAVAAPAGGSTVGSDVDESGTAASSTSRRPSRRARD